MEYYYLTDPGMVRDHNEDSVIILQSNGCYLMAIADGMGGHRAGEVASSIAINYLGKHFKETFINLNKVDAVKWIRTAYEEINALIFEHEKNNPESKGMGTTLVMAILTDDYLLLGNVGDSSGFVMKDKSLHKVTYDHTLVNLLVSAGELTKLLKGLNCYVNLIPYNETQNISFKRTKMIQISRFYDILKKKGINVTIRREFGGSISAACGQLRSEEEK